ncbi:hypothetical protein THRCLA_06708 [Thraustotheca clavata]|uniref:Secreted protein n=1 Tax=Thraustotheca clavata TaxID=74557 RepID=A0A1V9ZL58_9STRA|nr:hypothetical protein THRCLA_06708 [Thraustotheca clavata]
MLRLLASTLLACIAIVQGKFVVVDPADPFVVATTNEFLDNYDRFLSDVFAIVSDKQILSAQVYKHPLLLEDEDPIYLPGATYRLNVLLKLQFDSPQFKGNPYLTVANCVFVCVNTTEDEIDCDGQTFEQFPREALPFEQIEANPVRAFLNNHLNHAYDDAIFDVTAYEVQNDSIHNDMVEYFRFTAEGEPIECEAVAYRNGTTTQPTRTMLYFDDKCLVAKYHGLSLAQIEKNGRMHMTLMITILVFAGIVAAVVAVRRRSFSKRFAHYRPVNIRFQRAEAPQPQSNMPVQA